LDPKDFSLLLKAAQLYLKADQTAEALDTLGQAEKLAQNDEEAEAVLVEQLKIYQLDDSLPKRASELAAEVKAESATPEQLFLLARLYEAQQQYPEALAAIEKALHQAPQKVRMLATAARIYEQSGNLQSAADLNRKLALADRRGRSDYLKHVSQLETQLGRTEQALQAGRELITSAPGNTENYEFYAELCFRLNQSEEGLQTLRRAIRVNPTEPKLLLTLAGSLAEQFRTDEAIELYWQAFEKATGLDDKLGIVPKLADLYLQTNHFDRLLERVERLRRDASDKREATICLAQAYHSAGDYGMARQELESLLTENTRETH
jgi:tetratricopeptide (TPR) repeat protein